MPARAGLFALLCGALLVACEDTLAPRTGAIRVNLTTAGDDIDTDGYALRIAHGTPIQFGIVNGALIFAGLRPGETAVRLEGLAVNCQPLGITDLRIDVVADDTVDVAFDVDCHLLIGSLLVEVVTSGLDRDLDGYFVSLDGGPERAIVASTVFDSVRVGVHTLTLSGIEDNCAPAGPAAVQVMFRSSARATYSVSCARRTGFLSISANSTGQDIDQNGYDVVVDGLVLGHLPPNGTNTINNLAPGGHSIALQGLTSNCTVSGTQPRPIEIVYQQTTNLAFDVACVPRAIVRVAAATTGIDQDVAYRVRLMSADYADTRDLPANGSVSFPSLEPGDYSIVLIEVGVNCDPVTPATFTRPVTVGASGTSEVNFTIACAQAAQVAFMRHESNGLNVGVLKSSGGALTLLTLNGGEQHDPTYSPDGTRLAFRSSRDGNSEIYVMNADGSAQTRLTNNTSWDGNPAWSPDGSRIAFRSARDGGDELYVMDANGSNVVRLTSNTHVDAKPSWSPDGTKIAFMSDRDGASQIYVMNADGSNVTRLTNTEFSEGLPSWSPDGSKIAFARDVYCYDYYYYYYSCHTIVVMNADGSNVVQFELGGYGSEPEWSPDGRWIVFEAAYCDYYHCYSSGIEALRSDGSRREMIAAGSLFNPTWRP